MSLNSQLGEYHAIMNSGTQFTTVDRVLAAAVAFIYVGYVGWIVYGLQERDELNLALYVTNFIHFGFLILGGIANKLSDWIPVVDSLLPFGFLKDPYYGLGAKTKLTIFTFDIAWFVTFCAWLSLTDGEAQQNILAASVIVGTVFCVYKAWIIVRT
tara:strand:+ start:210 stop:677 length:468 start_codon:yes stop_codon:yes gene_type:complete